jgi:hypothetical protein
VAETGGTRPPISLVDVRRLVVDHYSIPGDSFQVKWYFPEDIIIVFSYLNEMLQVLHEPLWGILHSDSSSRGGAVASCQCGGPAPSHHHSFAASAGAHLQPLRHLSDSWS